MASHHSDGSCCRQLGGNTIDSSISSSDRSVNIESFCWPNMGLSRFALLCGLGALRNGAPAIRPRDTTRFRDFGAHREIKNRVSFPLIPSAFLPAISRVLPAS